MDLQDLLPPPHVSLLQDRKIRALEELVQTLQKHWGKRLSWQTVALLLPFPGDPWMSGLQEE